MVALEQESPHAMDVRSHSRVFSTESRNLLTKLDLHPADSWGRLWWVCISKGSDCLMESNQDLAGKFLPSNQEKINSWENMIPRSMLQSH